MADKYIRKQTVFNTKSVWQMEILRRMEEESENFSGYSMSILKSYFDERPKVKETKKEQPMEAARIMFNGKLINTK